VVRLLLENGAQIEAADKVFKKLICLTSPQTLNRMDGLLSMLPARMVLSPL
jgi:hypothetical protein